VRGRRKERDSNAPFGLWLRIGLPFSLLFAAVLVYAACLTRRFTARPYCCAIAAPLLLPLHAFLRACYTQASHLATMPHAAATHLSAAPLPDWRYTPLSMVAIVPHTPLPTAVPRCTAACRTAHHCWLRCHTCARAWTPTLAFYGYAQPSCGAHLPFQTSDGKDGLCVHTGLRRWFITSSTASGHLTRRACAHDTHWFVRYPRAAAYCSLGLFGTLGFLPRAAVSPLCCAGFILCRIAGTLTRIVEQRCSCLLVCWFRSLTTRDRSRTPSSAY